MVYKELFHVALERRREENVCSLLYITTDFEITYTFITSKSR